MTQFILEQQELKLKKNSKSRKKRKQNTEEEEGKVFVRLLPLCFRIPKSEHWVLGQSYFYQPVCLTEYSRQGKEPINMLFHFLRTPSLCAAQAIKNRTYRSL